jgi:hypothetical protein
LADELSEFNLFFANTLAYFVPPSVTKKIKLNNVDVRPEKEEEGGTQGAREGSLFS